jgi:hypothetical protein
VSGRNVHGKWVPCHYGMARPLVADRGDGLYVWRVKSNAVPLNAMEEFRGGGGTAPINSQSRH